MQDDIGARCRDLGAYMVTHQCTIRQVAEVKGVPKSTVHKDVTKRLRIWDSYLHAEVRKLLEKNKAERHLRGGEATKRKYKK